MLICKKKNYDFFLCNLKHNFWGHGDYIHPILKPMCFICAYHIACHCLFSWDVYSSICAAGSAVITLNNEVEATLMDHYLAAQCPFA